MHSAQFLENPAVCPELTILKVTEPDLRSAWLGALGQSRAVGWTERGTLVRFRRPGVIELIEDGSPLGDRISFTSNAFDATIRIDASIKRRTDSGQLILDEIELYSIARRRFFRISVPPSHGRIESASAPELADGCVVDIGPDSLALKPLGFIPASQATVELRLGERRARGLVRVRNLRQRTVLRTQDDALGALLREEYLGRRFPRLVDRRAFAPGVVERFAERSGFLDLRPSMEIPPGWASSRLRPPLGRDAAFVSDAGDLVGLMSSTRTGQAAWMVHQLLAEKEHPEVRDAMPVLHDFMMTYPEVLEGRPVHLMCYFDQSKGRNEVYYHSFERWIGDPRLVGTRPLQRFERNGSASVGSFDDSIRIGYTEDEAILCQIARRHIGPLHGDALELFPGSVNRDCIDPEFERQGLRRGRRLVVLRRGDRFVAGALCEFGSRELSIFGLFNICFLFKAPTEVLSVEEECRLLAAVRTLYRREVDEEHPVVTSPPACFPVLAEPGTELAETMAWYVWHPSVLPQYQNFYRFRFGSFPYLRAPKTQQRPPKERERPMSQLQERYEPLLQETRGRLESDPILQTLSDRSIDPTKLLRFLIEYSARSVKMTEPVDSWIRRAGEATKAKGSVEVGDDLVRHAHHEEGHHLMLIEDTQRLAARWNEKFPTRPVDPQALIDQPVLPATQAYIDLHEDVIASEAPYGQVAIELEIEGLALSWAPAFVTNVKEVLGDEICSELSFLHEHIQLDIGHTAYNKRLMNLLLGEREGEVEVIAAVGRRALETYLDFLGQVWEIAEREVERAPVLVGSTEQAAAGQRISSTN